MASRLAPTTLATTSPSRTLSATSAFAGPETNGCTEAETGHPEATFELKIDGVGHERDAGRLPEDHPLHDHSHVEPPVVDAVAAGGAGCGPLGERRGPAPADVLADRGRAHDVQVRVTPSPAKRTPCAGPVPSRWIGRRRQLARRAGRERG